MLNSSCRRATIDVGCRVAWNECRIPSSLGWKDVTADLVGFSRKRITNERIQVVCHAGRRRVWQADRAGLVFDDRHQHIGIGFFVKLLRSSPRHRSQRVCHEGWGWARSSSLGGVSGLEGSPRIRWARVPRSGDSWRVRVQSFRCPVRLRRGVWITPRASVAMNRGFRHLTGSGAHAVPIKRSLVASRDSIEP